MYNALLLMGAPGQSGLGSILPMLLIIVVFYFFMIRPQMKKAKEAKTFRESLKKGDTVVTIGGIHGRITEVNETTFILEAESGAKFRVEKSAVSNSPNDQLIAGK
ncbi:MAG TPA: preprotein translocase subunit YajC [Flavobacteriales bacterium]|jgi:preprotein translocase subunit YajC|nr:preprotein translocase subunit YajC [Flavobacteriales bacterium]